MKHLVLLYSEELSGFTVYYLLKIFSIFAILSNRFFYITVLQILCRILFILYEVLAV